MLCNKLAHPTLLLVVISYSGRKRMRSEEEREDGEPRVKRAKRLIVIRTCIIDRQSSLCHPYPTLIICPTSNKCLLILVAVGW